MDKISEKLIDVTFGLVEKVSASSKEMAINIRDLTNETQNQRATLAEVESMMRLLYEHCRRQDPEWVRQELRQQRKDSEGLKKVLAFLRYLGHGLTTMSGQLVQNKLFWVVLILIILMKAPDPIALASALKLLLGAQNGGQ